MGKLKKKLIEIEQAQEKDDVNKMYNELENLFDDGSYWWLVERVQELEEKLIEAKDDYDYLSYHYGNETEQNKRYREALEFYADEGTYEVVETLPPTDEYQQPIEPVFKTVPIIYYDKGKTARKALESESE